MPESHSLTFGPVKVSPGDEKTECMVLRLDNATPLHIGQIHNALSDGSHHLIVYRTTDTQEQATPFACQPFSDTLHPEKGSPLMITQKHDETLTFPAGVGVTFDAHQMVRLEMHYINASPNDVMVQSTSTFTSTPDGAFKDEAGFLFVGDPDIKLSPHQKTTVGPVFLKTLPKVDGVNFFGITGHTHQFGTNVSVNVAADKNDMGTPVYDVPGWKWSEPATVYADPPFQIPSGGGFRFSCSWDNTSDATVNFGESANDEMCFFWSYYYPSQGALVCVHSEQVPGGIDLCCPGNPLCSMVLP